MSDLGYRSSQVCEITGVTYRQLDYWVRTGIVAPSICCGGQGSGTQRRWSAADVVRVAAVARLLAEGYTLQAARRLMLPVAS